MMLVNWVTPAISDVLKSWTVGSGSILQHMPRETTVLEPSSVIVPPPVAEVIVIPVTGEVVKTGNSFLLHDSRDAIKVIKRKNDEIRIVVMKLYFIILNNEIIFVKITFY